MKRILILLILAVLAGTVFSQSPRSVEESTRAGFERAQRIQIGDQEAISAEVFKPKTEVYVPKVETSVKPIYHRFNQNFIRTTNKILLNKWLKESK